MNRTATGRSNLIAGAIALVVMAVAAFAFAATGSNGGEAGRDPDPPAGSSVLAGEEAVTGPPSATSTVSDLPIVTIAELPVEALDTLLLIENGGPYPYRQDDGVFQNREGILPDRPPGHYREYTVDTSGSPDRGARRIVGGADGERYYTDDHYDSFREIVIDPPGGSR